MSLGLLPYSRSVKTMPRYVIAALAVELRERFLISELIFSHPSPQLIREFGYFGSNTTELIMRCCPPSSPSLDTVAPLPGTDESGTIDWFPKSYFSCGNFTVLNWGKIITNGHFHSRHEIYPLGFKYLRQEYDLVMNCLVDLVCEIDCYSVTDNRPTNLSDCPDTSSTSDQDLRPLFRVIVGWKNMQRIVVPKVYEGKRPEAVWHSILSEHIGSLFPPPLCHPLSPLSEELEQKNAVSEHAESGMPTTADDDMDEEERSLRSQLMGLREQYYASRSSEVTLRLSVCLSLCPSPHSLPSSLKRNEENLAFISSL
jgi:hypothetical protein